ncbi:MAG: class II aldolase/adducin family protein [Bacteroidetes bacterium]|nr:class II aldolase/adducin family protein [Bacteroidota bacterium]
MKYEQERTQITIFLRRMLLSGLTVGSGGNISVRIAGTDAFCISPTAVAYDSITAADIVVMRSDGSILDSARTPSSEWRMHAAVYQARAEVIAVVHTHSPYAATFACLREEIPAVHYLLGFAGRKVPLAPYATYGSEELAAAAVTALGNEFHAVLLATHGLLAVGRNLEHAFTVAEETEFVARVYWQARAIGTPAVLPDDEMQRITERFRHYGSQENTHDE